MSSAVNRFAKAFVILAFVTQRVAAADLTENQPGCNSSWLAQEWSAVAVRCDAASEDYVRRALADYHAPAYLAAHGDGPPLTDAQRAKGFADFEVAAKMEARAAYAFYRLPRIDGVPAEHEQFFAQGRAANMLKVAREWAKQAEEIASTPVDTNGTASLADGKSIVKVQALLSDPAFFSLKPTQLTDLSD